MSVRSNPDNRRRRRDEHDDATTAPAGATVPDGEAGIVAVWFALMMSVFVGLAALSVDVASWYARAQDLQHSADAAALAAVPYMPDLTKAATVAAEALARNGISTSKVSLSVSAGTTNRQVRVTLTDKKVPTFFGRALSKNPISITRRSLAEYTASLSMGSAQNYLGWGGSALSLAAGVPASAATPNFWLGLNGYCVPKEQGDLLSARYDGNFVTTPAFHCGPNSPTGTYFEDQSTIALVGQLPSYNANGYVYAVKAPAPNTQIWIYDPAYCPSTKSGDGKIDQDLPKPAGAAATVVALNYTLRSPDTAGTPNDYSDDAVAASGSFSACANQLSWVKLHTANTVGTYTLQISTPAAANSLGANLFALRATKGTDQKLCDARLDAACPQVSGLTAMSIMATMAASTTRFTFAEVPKSYAGKQIVLGLWDPGEGMTSMKVIMPSGNPTTFRTMVTPSPTGGTPSFSTGQASSLDVSGCGSSYVQPGPNRAGNCRYNDRLVELLIDIPTNYSGGWWSIEYASGTAPSDRTTWTVRVVGDPAHLTRD